MAGSQSHIRGIPVMFVRHGQSTNNVILEPLLAQEAHGKISREDVETKFRKERVDDPPLTKTGVVEAKQLGKHLKKALVFNESGVVQFYTSPFKRTLDTTKYMLESFQTKEYNVTVHPDIFESGGVYMIDDHNRRVGPGKCYSANDIANIYKGYNVSLLPEDGQWYVDGWEHDGKSRMRAQKVATWIKSTEFVELYKGSPLTTI